MRTSFKVAKHPVFYLLFIFLFCLPFCLRPVVGVLPDGNYLFCVSLPLQVSCLAGSGSLHLNVF